MKTAKQIIESKIAELRAEIDAINWLISKLKSIMESLPTDILPEESNGVTAAKKKLRRAYGLTDREPVADVDRGHRFDDTDTRREPVVMPPVADVPREIATPTPQDQRRRAIRTLIEVSGPLSMSAIARDTGIPMGSMVVELKRAGLEKLGDGLYGFARK